MILLREIRVYTISLNILLGKVFTIISAISLPSQYSVDTPIMVR